MSQTIPTLKVQHKQPEQPPVYFNTNLQATSPSYFQPPNQNKSKAKRSKNNHKFTAHQTSNGQFHSNPDFAIPNEMPDQIQIPCNPDSSLRFSNIQKSIEILRIAIPQMFNDAFVDELYLTLFQKFKQIEMFMNNYEVQNPVIYQPQTSDYNRQETTQPFQTFSDLNFSDQDFIDQKSQKKSTTNNKKKYPQPKQNKRPLREIWNSTLERQLLQQYKSRKPFNEIRNNFIQKYPQYQDYFTYYQIRGQCHKTLRAAIRKLYYYIDTCKDTLPPLQKIKQPEANFIYYYKSGYQVRLLLVDLYQQDQFNHQFAAHLIQSINHYLSLMAYQGI